MLLKGFHESQEAEAFASFYVFSLLSLWYALVALVA